MRDELALRRRARAAVATMVAFYATTWILVSLLSAVVLGLVAATLFTGKVLLAALAIPFAIAVVALVRGATRSTKPKLPTHVEVTEAAAPALFATLRELSAEAALPAPARVLLVHGTNAGIFEERGPFSRRHYTLLLGAGLLSHLGVSELRAVVAHELGHFVAGDTEHTARVYAMRIRWAAIMREALVAGGPDDVVYLLYRWLWGRFERDAAAVARMQELTADDFSARLEGADTAVRALERSRESAAAVAVWSDVLVSFEALGARPRNAYEGLRRFTRSAQWASTSAIVRVEEGPTDELDAHPSTDDRIARLSRGEPRSKPRDDRPATALIAQIDQLESALCAATAPAHLRTFEWSEYGRALEAIERSNAQRIQARAPLLDARRLLTVLTLRDRWEELVVTIEPRWTGDATSDRAENIAAELSRIARSYLGTLLVARGWSYRSAIGEPIALERDGAVLELGALLSRLRSDADRSAAGAEIERAVTSGGVGEHEKVSNGDSYSEAQHRTRWSPVDVRVLGAGYEVRLLLRRARFPRCCVVCKGPPDAESVNVSNVWNPHGAHAVEVSLWTCNEHASVAHAHLRLREHDPQSDVAVFDTRDAQLASLIEQVNR